MAAVAPVSSTLSPHACRAAWARRAGTARLRSRVTPVYTASSQGGHSKGIKDVGKYIGEAVSTSFTPTHHSDVPWEGSGTPFSGRIDHHEGATRRHKFEHVGETPAEEGMEEGQVQGQHLGGALHDAVVGAIEHAMATDVEQGGSSLQGEFVRHRRDMRHHNKHH